MRPNASKGFRKRRFQALSQLFASFRRPILNRFVAPIQNRKSERHLASVIVDDLLERFEGVDVFRGTGLQGKLLAGIAAEMEDDRAKSVIALNVRSDAGDELAGTKIYAFLHLVPA